MKYRIVKVERDNTSAIYEVEYYTTNRWMHCWRFECKFNNISAAEQYIQSKAQPKRTVIKEYDV